MCLTPFYMGIFKTLYICGNQKDFKTANTQTTYVNSRKPYTASNSLPINGSPLSPQLSNSSAHNQQSQPLSFHIQKQLHNHLHIYLCRWSSHNRLQQWRNHKIHLSPTTKLSYEQNRWTLLLLGHTSPHYHIMNSSQSKDLPQHHSSKS